MEYIVTLGVVAASMIGVLIGRAYERNAWHERIIDRTGLLPGDSRRFAETVESIRRASHPDPVQLAEALDAIALEVERIGEGQRFLTKLLAERDQRVTDEKAASPVARSVRSPLPTDR